MGQQIIAKLITQFVTAKLWRMNPIQDILTITRKAIQILLDKIITSIISTIQLIIIKIMVIKVFSLALVGTKKERKTPLEASTNFSIQLKVLVYNKYCNPQSKVLRQIAMSWNQSSNSISLSRHRYILTTHKPFKHQRRRLHQWQWLT